MSTENNTKSAVGSVLATVVLSAACVTGGWIARELMPKKSASAVAMPQQAAQSVAVSEVKKMPYASAQKFVAHAEAMQEVDLLPQVDGYIKEMLFKEGDTVKAGQLLYILDDERYQAVANQRKADLAAAVAEERRAERYFKRMQEADSRGITQLERDNAEAAFESAKAGVLQAKANLVVAEYDLKKTKVYAPISGQIGKSNMYVGDYVAPSKGALARIVQIDPMRVSFPLTDRSYIAWRRAKEEGKAADYRLRLVLADGSIYNQEGTWAFDDNAMSLETATIQMRLSFPNPERLLVPNSYVTLLSDDKVPPEYPSVPQSAVTDMPGGNVGVYVLGSDSTVTARNVKVLPAANGFVPVIEGLEVGEKVVCSGVGKLGNGMKVVLATPTANDENPDGVKAKTK
ncbi:MAG: efflux RND transporter periplasmic adaptor subunit [Kiritimatiellae bacterium]|nr:efflux RND transporter periplasmic adaptor subunit [Kiritimatiellia bacterium]